MYLTKSLKDGIEILLFNKKAIKRLSKEQSFEEIYLSNLFINYALVMLIYFIIVLGNGLAIGGREINKDVFLGLLLLYPLLYNTIIYVIYIFYGIFSEIIEKKNLFNKFLVLGFHKAYIFNFLFFVNLIIFFLNVSIGKFIFSIILSYFFILIFYIISCFYRFSFAKVLQVFLIPIFALFLIFLFLSLIFPNIFIDILRFLFI